MSKYTTEVRYICEKAAGMDESSGYLSVNEVLNKSWAKVFNFDFPMFDEAYRSVLCSKILKHYYTREISEETVGLWKLRLDTKMNEVMPYYNQLYKSQLLEFNPFYDVDMTTTNKGNKQEVTDRTEDTSGSRTGDNQSTRKDTDVTDKTNKITGTDSGTSTDKSTTKLVGSETTESSSETVIGDVSKTTNQSATTMDGSHQTANDGVNRDAYSDTPQGALTNLENNTYLTNARKITDNKTESGTEESSTNVSGEVNFKDDKTESVDGTGSKKTNDTTTVDGSGSTSSTSESNETGKDDRKYDSNVKGEFTENTTGNLTGQTQVNTTDGYIQTVVGKTAGASYSKLLTEFRKTFLNIDMMVIEELSPLFFGLW